MRYNKKLDNSSGKNLNATEVLLYTSCGIEENNMERRNENSGHR
jgi:hypothetical protein